MSAAGVRSTPPAVEPEDADVFGGASFAIVDTGRP